MVQYIRSDLEFILDQIKISEAHAAGQPLYGPGGLIPTYNLAWGLRTVDGSYNHLLPGQELWGAADQPFSELVDPVYRTVTVMMDPDGPGPSGVVPVSMPYLPGNDVDGPGTFAGPGDVIDPEVRTISNLIVDQTLSNPAAILTALQRAGVDPALQLTITADISNAYAPLAALFQAVAEAERNDASASAAANASPGNVALQDAAAAAAAALADARANLDLVDDGLMALLDANGITLDGANVHLPNIAPDEGLSAPFNSWFTLFGQFFDHGLDLVNKGNSGTVMIPLQPDDPLYVPGSTTNFMVLTRATVTPGEDGIWNTEDDVRPINTTTPFVDQNQTYTSHPSHQVFLRQYVLDDEGRPVATGKLIEGQNGGMATWADVKAQAASMLGIQLTDFDVGSVPLVRTDPYGNFIPDANGMPQIIVGIGGDGIPNTADDAVMSGTTAVPIDPTAVLALRTNHAFLADIAHNAVPEGKIADGDITIGLGNPGNGDTEYDNELLDAHFIAGDGRVNENIGLTAVHHVFHAEHNRLVEHTKDTVLADAQALLDAGASAAQSVEFLNEWLADDVAAIPADTSTLVWDGERLFQAAKFGTEMQYQHLVFEEFARKIQPTINTFLVPDGFDTTLDPTIVAEFAHVVYRFGHSMLTESIDRFDPNFVASDIGLIEGFLNPTAFNGVGGVIDDDIAAGAIIRGMTRQAGNQIDEFVTSALRNNLLGLPLDLATINLARGRDTGVPTLQEARADFYEASNQNILLKPYDSWVDFASHLKHEASIINFIASYGTHSTITEATTLEGKRDAALALIGLTTTSSETVAISNASFELDSLADGAANVVVSSLGNYTTTPPTGWSMTGTGGLFDPADGVTNNASIDGTNVVWLGQDAVLSQDTGVVLAEGATYSLSFDIGDRTDTAWPGGTARLLSTDNTVLATMALVAPADGNWSTVTFNTGVIGAAVAGQTLRIEIQQAGGSADQILIDDIQLNVTQPLAPLDEEDRQAFLNGTGAYADNKGGLDLVDLWIGGLAEETMPFGGMLGSTFNFVFEVQMEMLQSGDRFYYLQRLDGLHLFGEMENNSFAAMIMRNTDATHLPSDVFSTPGLILEVDQTRQFNDLDGDGTLESTDPVGSGLLTQLVIRNNPATVGPDSNYLRYTGGDHVVIGGTEANDVLIGGIGDDTLFGDGGADYLDGGFGNDILNGGDGDDIIVDAGGDDNIKGGAGNDVIHAGPGLDLVLSGSGHDFVFLGTDEGSEVFAGEGNDYIYGNKNAERILGNEGNDWIETGTFDGAPGDNFDEIFSHDDIDGHDVFLGDGGFDEYIGEGGDDIMVGSAGRGKMVGMSGFDWATYKDNPFGINADIGIPIVFDEAPILPANASLDEYESVEGLSGTAHDDILTGTDETAATLASIADGGSGGGYHGSVLDAEGILLIDGLQEVIGAGVTEFGSGDIILGGAGSDLITGKQGDDIIDGDKWLNVRIAVHESVGADGGTGAVLEYANSMTQLASRMFSGEINAGQLRIHRNIETADGTDDTDIAVFSDDFENYEIVSNGDGSIQVTHVTISDGLEDDGSDRVSNVEMLRFRDLDYSLVKPAVMLNTAVVGSYADNFESESYGNSDGTTTWSPDWAETGDGTPSITGGQIQIDDAGGGNGFLRFDSGDGATLTRTIPLAGATSATLVFSVNEQNLDGGGDNDNVQVQFSSDGATGWTTVYTIDDDTGNENPSVPLPGPFTATSAIRFVVSSFETTGADDIVDISSLRVDFTTPVAVPTADYATTYTENGAGVPIASGPSITDDGTTLVSARVLLTNAQPGDDLDWGTMPAGITATQDNSVEGQVAVNLTGTASLAAYQAAIQAVTFDSTSEVGGDRIIQVTVNDGFNESDPATTTVTVVSVNDAPNAVTDNIVTNLGNSFTVEQWMMLQNDTDPEGNPLSVTGATDDDANFTATFTAGNVTATRTDGDNTKDFTYTVSDGALTDTADVDITWDTTGNVDGSTGNDIVLGNDGASTFDAGEGDDIVMAGGGIDTIVWNANAGGATDGFDRVDGGLGTDTFDVNTRANTAEIFRVYTRDAAESAGIAVVGLTTEIIITRQAGASISVIAELDNIEEIRIGTQTADPTPGGAGGTPGDSVQIFGDFSTTSLALNTITIDGNAGDDTIDISGLTSAHRIVFKSNGGNDTIVGTLRPQDVIELPEGTVADDFTQTTDENGVTTLTDGTHHISFTADGNPQLVEYDDHDDDDHDDDDEDHGNDHCGNDNDDDDEQNQSPSSGSTITGTAAADVLLGTAGADAIVGLGGADFLSGMADRDILFGGGGDDNMLGGGGNDMLYGDGGEDRIFGNEGDDLIDAGMGNDTVYGGAGNDIIVAARGDGDDLYYGDEMSSSIEGNDTLDMSAIIADLTVDLGNGFLGRGSASSSQSGSDTLWSIENVLTGSGSDTITASNAVNVMDGGGGNDTFRFLSSAAANGDTIVGFQPGDIIDLSGIDADTGSSAHEFTLVTASGFNAAGALQVTHEILDGEEYTVVQGNTNGGSDAEFRLNVKGHHDLTTDDFDL